MFWNLKSKPLNRKCGHNLVRLLLEKVAEANKVE